MQRTSILGVFLSPFQLEFPITYLIGKYIFFFLFFFFNLEIIATFILKRERVVSMFSIREKKGISHPLCKYIFYAFISDQLSPIRALCARFSMGTVVFQGGGLLGVGSGASPLGFSSGCAFSSQARCLATK